MPTPVTPFRHDCPCDRTGHWSVRKCSAPDGDAMVPVLFSDIMGVVEEAASQKAA
jgi:hypothetical protein